MVRIDTVGPTAWRNYHRTIDQHVADHRCLHTDDASAAHTARVLAESASAIMEMLDECERARKPVLGIGSAWSFSDIVRPPNILFETRGCSSQALIEGSDGPLVLATAGSRIVELNNFLETRGLSLRTSGSHNGQTLGGATGTGIHGSALGQGGFQNQVRGVHLLTGPAQSIWLERGPNAAIDPALVSTFAGELRRDPDLFDAALVHLGGLGIVNGVLLEPAPGFSVDVVRCKLVMTRALVAVLAAGDFEAFARHVWRDTRAMPYYVEVTLNPFAPFDENTLIDRPALVTLFFKQPQQQPADRTEGSGCDVLNLIARVPLDELLPLPRLLPEAVTLMFDAVPDPGEQPPRLTWGEANGAHKWPTVAGFQIAFGLYNAAFAVPRDRLAEAIDLMLAGFAKHGGGHLVFTIRFVSNAAGLLTFTRFPETAVINLDGLRTPQSERAARDVALALERGDIPFSQHWAKMGAITRNRLAREYGDPSDPLTPAGRWSRARAALVTEAMQPLFGSDQLRRWGLA